MTKPPTPTAHADFFTQPLVAEMCDRAIAKKVVFTNDMIAGSQRLQQTADAFTVIYAGSLDFARSVHSFRARNGYISTAQARGMLNVLVADYRNWKAAQPQTDAPAPTVDPIAELADAIAPVAIEAPQATTTVPVSITHSVKPGVYTVVLDEAKDVRRTIKVVPCEGRMGQHETTMIVSVLNGPDNASNYKGFAFLYADGTYKVWNGYKGDGYTPNALRVLVNADDAMTFGEAYAIASGRCWKCGRLLTVPASVSRGLGPICAKQYGV
jgi:hypothetical protein